MTLLPKQKPSKKNLSGQVPQQIPLPVSLSDEATFGNYYAPEDAGNTLVINTLKEMLQDDGERSVFIWGAQGCGLTHLLQAACHSAEIDGYSVQYLPLDELSEFPPEALFDGLEAIDLICLDGIEHVLGKESWEKALFHLFNRLRDADKCLLMAASQGPHELPVQLPDLRSRLSWGLVYQIQSLDDEQKLAALQMRAKRMGLELAADVAQFILHRAPRGTAQLFEALRNLDHASLKEQRRLTIPFVKQALNY